jgi:predicted acyltransferase
MEPQESPSAPPPQRLTSIDAYRGLVMMLMMGEVLDLKAMGEAFSQSPVWTKLAYHQEHVEWIGCSLHDMIQPSFSFLVGVALPFSLLNRASRGQSLLRRTLHAAWRAFILVFLGVFLRSLGRPRTNFTFEDTLSQIGLGYVFLYLIALRPTRDQIIALLVILVGIWAAFALYPLPGKDFDYASVGVPAKWAHEHILPGFAAHWNKNSNLAWAFDRWFLNVFPRDKPFQFNGGGYSTLSFIPTLGTMILGLLAGGVLNRGMGAAKKLGVLMLTGSVCLGLGYALGWAGICPVVKRIWTPSWVLYSGGLCFLFLAFFYLSTDVSGWKGWALPLVVVGMNSIAAYLMSWLFKGFIGANLRTHLGAEAFKILGDAYEPLLKGAAVLLILWVMLFAMYRKKVFLRI